MALRAGGHDVAHAWHVTDALAAGRWRRVTGRVAVQSYVGVADIECLRARRWRLGLTLGSLRACDVTVALSRHAADALRKWLGYDPPVIPAPVDVHAFALGHERTEAPTFVCATPLQHQPGTGSLLVRAFSRVRRQRADARLLVNRPRDPAAARHLSAAGEGIEVVDMEDRSLLPDLYATAWASVLAPSSDALGKALAEGLACGTPGVGPDAAGIPEILDKPGTGRLFAGGDLELARAMLEVLELAEDPATREICRSRALELSTGRVAEAYGGLYARLIDRRQQPAGS